MTLVLSRQEDEYVMIGDDIKVTVVSIRGDKVRLGFDAPQELPIHRSEVYRAIQREIAAGHTPRPKSMHSGPDLSAVRLSEVCQMDLEGCDESRASDYFEAMHDLLCELRLMDERLKQWNQAATEFPGGPAKPGRLM